MILHRLNSEAWHCSKAHAHHFNNALLTEVKVMPYECTFCIYMLRLLLRATW